MDELDQERSTGQVIMAAAAGAAVLAGVALVLTRKKERREAAARAEAAAASVSDRTSEALAALEEHAPDAAHWLRERLAGLKKLDASTIEKAVSTSSHEARKSVRETGSGIRQRTEAMLRDLRKEAESIDLAKLNPTQAAAAQAVAGALAHAERTLGSGATLADSAREGTHALADELAPALRDAVLHAADLIGEQLRAARTKAGEVAPAEPERAAAHLTAAVREHASELGDRAEHLGERAKDTAREAAEATVETGKESGALFAWLAAALGVIFYLLLDEERRRQVTAAAGEASVQFRELVRDFRGYDDEF
ncbi:MAG: hypothetical protein IT337_11000 [Thermomicrobiales bacterium]|nr:hypothetical protein [Thermomicrobiales bacterium]